MAVPANLQNLLIQPNAFLGVYTDQRAIQPATPFLDTFFKSDYASPAPIINLGDIFPAMQVATYVRSSIENGKPIYQPLNTAIRSVQAPYIKLFDPVLPSEVARVQIPTMAGENLAIQWGNSASLEARYMWLMKDKSLQQINSVRRAMERQARQAIFYSAITVEYDDKSSSLIEFERNNALDQTLTGSDLWDSNPAEAVASTVVPVNIPAQLQLMANNMANSYRGGRPNTIFFGSDAWMSFINNELIRESRNLFLGQSVQSTMNSTLSATDFENPVSYMGNYGGISLYVVNGLEEVAGSSSPIIDSRDIVLVSGGFMGTRAMAPIEDSRAMGLSSDIWNTVAIDPVTGAVSVQTQSSTLMIPTNPNTTARMRVCANSTLQSTTDPFSFGG